MLRVYANKAGAPCDRFTGMAYARWVPVALDSRRPEKSHCSAHIPLDLAAKASIAVRVDGRLLGRRPAWLQSPGLWRCKHRDRRGAEMENEAMATRKSASKRRPRQRLRSIPGSSTSRSAIASAKRNVAIRGHGHALPRPGSIKQEQRGEHDLPSYLIARHFHRLQVVS